MNLRKTLLAAVLAAGTFLSGCGVQPNFQDKFKEISKKDYSFTEEQADVGCAVKMRDRYTKKEIDKKTGKIKFVPKYNHASLEDQLNRQEKLQSTIDSFLEYNINNLNESEFIEKLGLREKLERREEEIDFRIRRLKKIILYKKFVQNMGYKTENSEKIEKLTKDYNIGIYFPGDLIDTLTKIDAEYVKNAGYKDKIEDLTLFTEFQEKIKNPDFPTGDKIKRFIWEKQKKGFNLKSFDFDLDKRVDYIEIIRQNKDGKLESKPALVIYKSLSSSKPNIVVLDYEKEGERGFNEPDEIHKIRGGVDSGFEFCRSNEKLIQKLFEDRTKKERTKPKIPETKIEIVKAGDLEEKLWEIDMKNGFTVYEAYTNKDGNNYNLEVEYKDGMNGWGIAKKIEYIKKRFKDPMNSFKDHKNRVIEFYRLKPAFANKKFIDVDIWSNDYITLTYEDGSMLRYRTEAVLMEHPEKISFDFGTRYRDTIADRDGKDNPRYEARKRSARPFTVQEYGQSISEN